MGIVIFGEKQTPIGVEELLIKCPSCESHSWADAMISSSYFHFYYVPIFPFDKSADVICKKCGIKRYGRSFNASLVDNYDEIGHRFRHPLFTYTGAAICLLLIIAAVLSAML
jgi:hypothetical protein